MPAPKKRPRKGQAGLLGLGLDNTDGHTRVTTGENFLLVGGSQETHERMQETAVKINEKLDKRGKRLDEISRQEFREIAAEVGLREVPHRPDHPEGGEGPSQP